MNVTVEAVPTVAAATTTPKTPRTPRGTGKPKPTSSHAGFRYEVGNPRKNGSEVWKCVDKDCKASVIKKGDSFSLTREHTLAGVTLQTTLQHATMTLMQDRALKFPTETAEQIILNITTAVRDLVIATAPPASFLERVIAEWRQEAEQEKAKKKRGGSTTPKNATRKGESSRKRLKMTPKGKHRISESDEEEEDTSELEKLEDELNGKDESEGEDEDEGEEDQDLLEFDHDKEDQVEQTVPVAKKRPRQSGSDDDFA